MIHLNGISYGVLDRTLFNNLKYSFQPKRYGLIGANGIGKTTLAKIITGDVSPSTGTVTRDGNVDIFKQNEPQPAMTVSEFLLDIWSQLNNSINVNAFLENINFESSIQKLSGGEWTRVRLCKILASPNQFIILDEPTNNLDIEGRTYISNFIRNYLGGLLVISHDKEILRGLDVILELTENGISTYGGNFDFYEQEHHAKIEREEKNLETFKSSLRKKKQEREKKVSTQEKRQREAQRKVAKSGLPKILIGARKRNAQKTAGKIRIEVDETVDNAVQELENSWNQMAKNPFIRFDFTAAKPPAAKVHFTVEDLNFRFNEREALLWKENLNFSLKGNDRIHIQGLNGSGKSTLINLLLGSVTNGTIPSGFIRRGNSYVSFLDQKYGSLNPQENLMDNIIGHTRFSPTELRNELAFFGFRREKVHQLISSLSGGELLKAALAKAVLGIQLPEVLILDEPTNNLDIQSQNLLVAAIEKFEGAIILVTHDRDFSRQIKITNELHLK